MINELGRETFTEDVPSLEEFSEYLKKYGIKAQIFEDEVIPGGCAFVYE